MKKYAFLFFVGFLVVSCKTQSKFEDKNMVYNNVLENSISLDAVQLHGMNYAGRAYKTDSIYVYRNAPESVIDWLMNVRKLENKK